MNKYEEAFEKVKDACVGFDTVDELIELKKLVEKATQKKPIDIEESVLKWGKCPTCKGLLNTLGNQPNRVFKSERYCKDCGQALDWSEEE